MAHRVTTTILCDPCLQEGREVEAKDTPPVTIGTGKPRIVALCELHEKELFAPFRDVLSEVGQVIPSPGLTTPPKFGKYTCPDPTCPKHLDGYQYAQGLRDHAQKQHHASVPELRERFGATKPKPEPTESEGDLVSLSCPECAKVFAQPEYKVPTRAIAIHRARQHGVRSERVTTGKRPSRAKARSAA